MKIKIKIIILFIIFFSISGIQALENKILFKVNNEIITSIDLFNEIQYLSLLNKNLNDFKEENIFEIAKNSLIKEKNKKIELSKYFEDLKIDQKFYELYLNDFIKKLELNSSEDFEKLITGKNLKMENIKKLTIQLLDQLILINSQKI